MPQARRALILRASLLTTVVLLASAAAAAPPKPAKSGGDQNAWMALLLLLLIPPLHLLLSSFAPAFTRRAQRALTREFWSCLGWGGLIGALTGIMAAIFGANHAKAGQTAAAAVGVFAIILALAGLMGMAKRMGDWALRRWGLGSLGPLSVILGSVLWMFAAVLPIFGWVAGLLTLIASLGAGAQVLLRPHSFDEPAAVVVPEPPPAPEAASAEAEPQ